MKLDPTLVSCLMVTRNRPALAMRAVRSFLDQSYPDRELVIVDESDADWSDLLPNDAMIRWHHFPSGKGPLGKMRNLSLELARGSLVMQWDDDDWSHPERISRQVEHLDRLPLGFLERLTMIWPERRQAGITPPRKWECAFIARRDRLRLVYPELRKAEDSALFDALVQRCPHKLLDAHELYVRTVHGANTWEADHFEKFQASELYIPLDEGRLDELMARTGFTSDMMSLSS